MKPKRWHFVLAAGGGLLLALVALPFLGSNQPSYQGKPVSVWFKAYAYSSNAPPPGLYSFPYSGNARVVRWVGGVSNTVPGAVWPVAPRTPATPWPGNPAEDALRALGSNAVPYLVTQLRYGRLDRAYNIAFTNLPAFIQRRLANPGEKQWYQIRAMDALGELGDTARGATPALLELLRQGDPRLRPRVFTTLRRVYADGLAVSGLLLRLGDEKRYAEVLEVAGQTKWQGREVAQLFGEILDSPDRNLHLDAIRLLEAGGERASSALDAVLGALRSQDREVRYLAARTVENICRQVSPEARPKIEAALRPCLSDQHEMVRNVAARTLANLPPGGSASMEARAEVVARPATHGGKTLEEWFQIYVAGAAERMPANDSGAMNGEFLRSSPGNAKPEPAWLAIQAIGSNAIPGLVRHLSGDAKERTQAIELIYRLGPAAQTAVPALLALLQPAENAEAEEVYAALRNIPAGQSVINEFLLTLAKQNRHAEFLRHARSLGWSGSNVVQQLGGMLSSSDATLHRDAMALLEAAGEQAVPAVAVIIAALRDPDGEVRYLAARALENIGKQATPEMRAQIAAGLKHCLQDSNPIVSGIARRLVTTSTEAASQPQRGN